MAASPRTRLVRRTVQSAVVNLGAYLAIAISARAAYSSGDWAWVALAWTGMASACATTVWRATRAEPHDEAKLAQIQRTGGVLMFVCALTCLAALIGPPARVALAAFSG